MVCSKHTVCIRALCSQVETEVVRRPELQKIYLLLEPIAGMQELGPLFEISWDIPKDKKPKTHK